MKDDNKIDADDIIAKKIDAESIIAGTYEIDPPKPKYVPDYKRPDFKPKRRPMKKAWNWIKDTVAGENKAGELVHGVLDLFPIPNQAVAKAVSFLNEGDLERAESEFKKLVTVRNGIALLLSILYLTGVISIDDIKQLLSVLGDFL